MTPITEQNLIFLHLPKNGGSTLHGILNRLYPKDRTFNIKVIDNTKLNISEFKELPIEDRAQIKLLKGHMTFGLHEYLVGPSKYITFLRKPEDRITSFYHYAKSRPQHRLYKKITENNWTLLDFASHSKDGDINNGQIRWISGLKNASEQEMLEKAKENIDLHFSFIGLQEQFDTSLIILSKLYGWGTPYYKFLNKGKYKKSSKLLDEETKQMIAQKNSGDNELYAYIEKRFEQQVKQINGLALQLEILRFSNKLHSSTLGKKLLKKFKYN